MVLELFLIVWMMMLEVGFQKKLLLVYKGWCNTSWGPGFCHCESFTLLENWMTTGHHWHISHNSPRNWSGHSRECFHSLCNQSLPWLTSSFCLLWKLRKTSKKKGCLSYFEFMKNSVYHWNRGCWSRSRRLTGELSTFSHHDLVCKPHSEVLKSILSSGRQDFPFSRQKYW